MDVANITIVVNKVGAPTTDARAAAARMIPERAEREIAFDHHVTKEPVKDVVPSAVMYVIINYDAEETIVHAMIVAKRIEKCGGKDKGWPGIFEG